MSPWNATPCVGEVYGELKSVLQPSFMYSPNPRPKECRLSLVGGAGGGMESISKCMGCECVLSAMMGDVSMVGAMVG